MTQSATPVPEDVGRLYDAFLGTGPMEFQNLHFGYWTAAAEPFADATDRLSDMVIERLGAGTGDRVLDVGCGVGGPALRLARLTGAEVVGISVSRRQVERANAAAAEAGLARRVSFAHADATALDFAPNSFDAVFALESMIHMPDRGQVLAQIARVLRPGGRLVLTDFFQRSPMSEQDAAEAMSGAMMTHADRARYPEWADAAGLEIVEDLDVTEHVVRPTYLEFARLAREAGAPDAEAGWTKLADTPQLGYLLLTARRSTTA
ncbi:MAG: SAM-dependent methyltransferase [Sporichthyaceae bacterium]